MQGNKKDKRVDGDVEYALKIARARIGTGTIVVCGTPTTTSRSLSIVTTTIRYKNRMDIASTL